MLGHFGTMTFQPQDFSARGLFGASINISANGHFGTRTIQHKDF